MTFIRQLRIKASQIAIFGCKKNFFVVNKLEEFSLPAYLKLKALLAKIFLGFILSAIALWWGAPRQIRHRVVAVIICTPSIEGFY
jgi:hypothetical protein